MTKMMKILIFKHILLKTRHTIKPLDKEDKLNVFNILRKIRFDSITHNKRSISAGMKDAFYILLKTRAKNRNPLLLTT